jgi:hypothetical protein
MGFIGWPTILVTQHLAPWMSNSTPCTHPATSHPAVSSIHRVYCQILGSRKTRFLFSPSDYRKLGFSSFIVPCCNRFRAIRSSVHLLSQQLKLTI